MAEPFLNPPEGETQLRAVRGPETARLGMEPDPPMGSEPPPDLFGRFMKMLQGYPGHVQESVVVGPGRATLEKMIHPALFRYLDKSTYKFPTRVSDAMPKDTSGLYTHLHPTNKTDVLGTIEVGEKFKNHPVVWNHEALHAAKDARRMNLLENFGVRPEVAASISKPPYLRAHTPTERVVTEPPYNGLQWTSPGKMAIERANRSPEMIEYRDFYQKSIPHISKEKMDLEVLNEWQARNSLVGMAKNLRKTGNYARMREILKEWLGQ